MKALLLVTALLPAATFVSTAQALDARRIKNTSWLLAREADGLGDAATLYAHAALHDVADGLRIEANDLRILARDGADDAALTAQFADVRTAFGAVEAEWIRYPYGDALLLRNNHREVVDRMRQLEDLFEP